MGVHMFTILNPPHTSLPIPSLWVIPVHQPQASCILHRTWTGDSFLIWYYTCFNAILPNHPPLPLPQSPKDCSIHLCPGDNLRWRNAPNAQSSQQWRGLLPWERGAACSHRWAREARHFIGDPVKAVHTVWREGTEAVTFKCLLLWPSEVDLYFEPTHTQPLTKVSQSNFTFTTSDALWHRPSLLFHFKNTLSSVNWFPTWTGWPLRSPGSSVVLRFDDRFQAGGNTVWCD